jgi:hypothetical protein
MPTQRFRQDGASELRTVLCFRIPVETSTTFGFVPVGIKFSEVPVSVNPFVNKPKIECSANDDQFADVKQHRQLCNAEFESIGVDAPTSPELSFGRKELSCDCIAEAFFFTLSTWCRSRHSANAKPHMRKLVNQRKQTRSRGISRVNKHHWG